MSSLDGIILDADQGFLELLQRRAAEIIGISYRAITDPRDLDRSADMLAMLEDRAAPVRLQKRYLRPDGSSIAANILVTRFSNPDRLISTLFWQEDGRALPPAKLWEAALRIRRVQTMQARLFGTDLSTDPVGSLLIGIYLAEAEGRTIGLADAAPYAGLALTTVARWVKMLQQRGILDPAPDPDRMLQLTKAGLDKVETMVAAVYEAPDTAAMPA